VEHELFGGKADESIGALIPRRGCAEDDWRERGERTRVGRCRPRNEILDILALGRGQDGEKKSRGRLAPVTGGGDNAKRALADPATAPFVSERGTPAAAANDLSSGTSAVRNRAGPDDQKDSSAVVERIVQRDQPVGIDDDFFRELLRVQRSVQRPTLLIPPRSGHAAVENSRKDGARLRDLTECARYQVSDHIRGTFGLSGRNRRLGSVDRCQNLALGGANEHACLRSATVDADHDLTHSSDLPDSAARA
jgi:hypothetical protein